MAKNTFTRNGGEERKAKSVAFVHHKGGTGKTTACLNVAGWLARMKKEVLVVDLDPQGNATAGLGVDRRTIDGSMCEVLFGQKEIEEIVLETDSGVHLAPSSPELLAAETGLAGGEHVTGLLDERLKTIRGYFDYILIDVPPGSTLLMINGVVAAGNIIIPLDTGVFAYETLETLKTLVVDLAEKLGIETNVEMILLREYPVLEQLIFKRLGREIRKMVRGFLSSNNIPEVKIFSIPFSRKVYGSQMKGIPISHYAPCSNVGRAYKKVTKELVKGEA